MQKLGSTPLVLLLLLGAPILLGAAEAFADPPDYVLLKRCTATMDERVPAGGGTWQIGVPFVSIRLADGRGAWPARHTFEFDTYAFCNGPNGYPEYGTGDDICLGRAADLPGTLVYSAPTQAPDAASGGFSLTDSPNGDYSALANSNATITSSFNLAGYSQITLVYYHHHALRWESGGDQGIVEVSNLAGLLWTPVKTHRNYLGDKGQFKRGEVDLSAFAGQTVMLRFRLSTDSGGSDDGWFIDDVRLLADGTTLFFDDFEPGLTSWLVTGSWGRSAASYNFGSLGSIDASGVYSTNPVTNPVSTGEGMGFAAVRAAFTQESTTRTAYQQVHHTAPQYKAAREIGYDNLCPATGACATTAVAGERAPERRVLLEQNRPNPFNPSTDIRFHLSEPAPVTLRIVDESGRVVRTLLDQEALPAGAHGLSWNGLDAGSQPVGSGVFFYELRVNGREHIRKMVLLR